MMGSGWENVSVVAGQPVELHCNVSGTPIPSITWHKDGHPVSHREKGWWHHALVIGVLLAPPDTPFLRSLPAGG